MSEDDASIAGDWIKYHYLPKREMTSSPLFAAWERLNDLVREEPEGALRIIKEIVRLDQSEWILANVAAGPVEDLLCYHGPQLIERIEELARRDPTVKKMLGAVWPRNDMSDKVWKRLKAVAGPSF